MRGAVNSLYYQESGDKNASLMVFLHGGGVSSWMWEKQIQYFKHYHCVAVDLPEQGKSRNTEEFSIKNSAEKAIELIENVAKDKTVIVIGFSLGAQVTIQMLSLNPSLIDFAFINSALVRPQPLLSKMIRPSIHFTFPLVKMRAFSKIQAKALYVDNGLFETYYRESSQMKPETLTRILEENMSFSIPEDFGKAHAKILVTVGEKEKAIMKRSAKEIVLSNPNCTGIILPNIGHGVPLALPRLFNQTIEQWIKEGAFPPDAVVIN
jgi:pimeloyl-ACP methyl ester carboxylesterase